MVVMHSCDCRACVNPAHLSLGTQADNLNDCRTKLRAFDQQYPEIKREQGRLYAARRVYTRKPPRKKKPHFHKLSDAEIDSIRRQRAEQRTSIKLLASQFNTSESNISMICSFKSRKAPVFMVTTNNEIPMEKSEKKSRRGKLQDA